MSLRDAQNMVRAFHQKFGVPNRTTPQKDGEVDWNAHCDRMGWLDSELDELRDAIGFSDMAELADAYIDIIVFALGGLVELGVDGTPLFDAVMRSNLLKVKLPGVAKIAKPEGWKHPDIGALIDEQGRGK